MHKFECRINIFFRKKAEISEIDTFYLHKIQKKLVKRKKKKKIEANNVDNENSENRREETISSFFIRFHFFLKHRKNHLK